MILTRHSLLWQIDKNECTWRAVEWANFIPEWKDLKATFSSEMAAQEFHSNYLEGLTCAQNSNILDELPQMTEVETEDWIVVSVLVSLLHINFIYQTYLLHRFTTLWVLGDSTVRLHLRQTVSMLSLHLVFGLPGDLWSFRLVCQTNFTHKSSSYFWIWPTHRNPCKLMSWMILGFFSAPVCTVLSSKLFVRSTRS